MSAEETLQQHLELCEEVYRLLLTENASYKNPESEEDTALLETKQALLDRLGRSVDALKALRAEDADKTLFRSQRSLLQQAQRRLMKILMLDRENETLLLKRGFQSRIRSQAGRPLSRAGVQDILSAYGGGQAAGTALEA